jgi:Fe-S-cluster containining protein
MVKVYMKVVTSFKMQLKRRYLMLLKKDVVEKGLKRRRGECLGCGACFQSSFPCPFLYEKDGKLLCRIHENKPDVCKTYPFNEEDVFPHTRATCGYYFVDEDDEEEIEKEKEKEKEKEQA